jgi:virginiamycin B lyase
VSRRTHFLLPIALCGALAQSAERPAPKPGVKEVQAPYTSLKPSATLKLGATADWVLITDDAVWAASTGPFALWRIDPQTNRIVVRVNLPGEACSGLAAGFGSIWVPICGKKSVLVRVDTTKNSVSATLPIAPAGPEGGITTSDDGVWMATDKNGTLARIDPSTNLVKQEVSLPSGSYNPIFSEGVVWVTQVEGNLLTAVESATGKVLESVAVGPNPRFLVVGGGSVWTLNQGDGTVSRVDAKTRKLIANIQVGIPGTGGDIGYGANAVWPTVFDVPLTRIDAASNKVVRQWVGKGGDSLRCGFDSIWIADYKKALLSRIPFDVLERQLR